MLKIGDLSRLAQVSVKTLRYYSDLGLLKPAWIDRYTGYRYYAAEQLGALNRILALKDLGFSLEQIGGLLSDSVSAEELRGMLRLRQAELERWLSEERARLSRVEARLRQIDREGHPLEYAVVLKAIEARRVLAVQGTVAGYGQTAPLLERLQAALCQASVATAGAATLARYVQQGEHPTLCAEVGVPAPAGLRSLDIGAGLTLRRWPGAPAAVATLHRGDPENLPEAYGALMRWATEGGYQPTAPGVEEYLEGPRDGRPLRDWITEVRIPVTDTYGSLDQNEKERLMNPEIKSLPAFTAIGQLYRGKNEHGEIPAMWGELNRRWDELVAIRRTPVAYGLCGNMQPDGSFEYLAAVETGPSTVPPQGMTRWQVPAQTYAVFPCTLATIHEAYERAYQVWLPSSGYHATGGIDMELYPVTFEVADAEKHEMFVYIPVAR